MKELLLLVAASTALALLILVVRGLLLLFRKQPFTLGKRGSVRTMVVLGSGGHTAEMLMLMDALDKQAYSPRSYVVAATDRMSGAKALAREASWAEAGAAVKGTGTASVHVIPRSREVGQSYLTSVGTTLYSLWFAFSLVLRERPELLLVNGPGTCIPICAAAFVFRVLGLLRTRIIYVESIARTRRFSLSAKILYHSRLADMLFVQWEGLLRTYPRAVYKGRLY